MEVMEELLCRDQYNQNLSDFLDRLGSVIQCNIYTMDSLTVELTDIGFLEEVKGILSYSHIALYFGKTLRDLKCVLVDEDCLREHEIFIQYQGPKKLVVTSASFPHAPLQGRTYSTLDDVVSTFKKHLESLVGYFYELECMDRFCTIMEPLKPSLNEDFRRIYLDDRTWLHVEVTPEGCATNIHLIGQSELWQDKLQTGLLKWDHDMDIVKNIMNMFDLIEFPVPAQKLSTVRELEDKPVEVQVCSICLCEELPDIPGVPLPLCQNPSCGIYFHRSCLFQWLVACAGGRPPAFGVANGSCPTCLQPIACNEKDH